MPVAIPVRAALVALSIAVCAVPAAAQNLGFMRDSTMSNMTRQDSDLLWRNVNDALALPDGHVSTWNNPKTGHSGTATPVRSFTQQGMACRALDLSSTAAGKTASSSYTFCKTKAGWKVLS
jgi:surface antigen